MIVDQGILLEYYLDDQYADECETVIGELASGEATGHLTTFHLHGVYAIFDTYFGEDAPTEIGDLAFSVAAAEGLQTYPIGTGDAIETARIEAGNEGLDFDDSVLVRAADALEADVVLAIDDDLDEHYEGPVEFDRVHPKDYR